MITLPELYPHQQDHIDRLRAALKARRSVILQAEPGVGKTRMSKWTLAKYSTSKGRTGNRGTLCLRSTGGGWSTMRPIHSGRSQSFRTQS